MLQKMISMSQIWYKCSSDQDLLIKSKNQTSNDKLIERSLFLSKNQGLFFFCLFHVNPIKTSSMLLPAVILWSNGRTLTIACKFCLPLIEACSDTRACLWPPGSILFNYTLIFYTHMKHKATKLSILLLIFHCFRHFCTTYIQLVRVEC